MLQSSILSNIKLLQPKEFLMATSDQEQKTGAVPQHKRMAMGSPVNGQSMPANGGQQKQGGLQQAKKK
jgi:hypothetical protein